MFLPQNYNHFIILKISLMHSIRNRPIGSTSWSSCVLFYFVSLRRLGLPKGLFSIGYRSCTARISGLRFLRVRPVAVIFFFFWRFPKYYFLQTFFAVALCFPLCSPAAHDLNLYWSENIFSFYVDTKHLFPSVFLDGRGFST